MSEPERPSQSPFVRELTRLHNQRLAATDVNERLMLDAQIAKLMREGYKGDEESTDQFRDAADARRRGEGGE